MGRLAQRKSTRSTPWVSGVRLPHRLLMVGFCLSIAGCSVTQHGTSTSSVLPALRTIDIMPPTTLAVPTQTVSIEGYVVTVVDGHTFDLQNGQNVQRTVLSHIQVPDLATCEGGLARALLAQLIAGKQVRVDPQGFVWLGDVDVAMTMVSYGMARATDATYAIQDTNSPDVVCGEETTTTTLLLAPLPVAPTVRPKPKPVRTTVEVPDTQAPAVVDTQAPPDTPDRPAPVTESPVPPVAQPTEPRVTEPPVRAPEPVVTDAPAATPRAPETPRTPKLPDAPADT